MLLHNKTKIIVKHKILDSEYSITWKYDNDKYKVTIEKYINGYLSPGYTKELELYDINILENKLDLLINCNNSTIKAY